VSVGSNGADKNTRTEAAPRAPLRSRVLRRRAAVFVGLLALHGGHPGQANADAPQPASEVAQGSVSSPLEPVYAIRADGSVTLRICFNWSCLRRQILTFTPEDMVAVKEQLRLCPSNNFHDRVQRLRIGVWQMELLAMKYQPLLANDRAVNESEHGIEGRTDCIDNSTNTTTFLRILQDLQQLPGWSVSTPQVRHRFSIHQVHWTAVVIDAESDTPWSADSWYRPHGHLPMVMPLSSWSDEKLSWEPPFDRINPTPRFSYELCGVPQRQSLSESEQGTDVN
jgi:hypothetical protein